MSASPLLFVLELLRRIKAQPEFAEGHSALHLVSIWVGDGGVEAQLKLIIAVQMNLAEAESQIIRSDFDDEAKDGLLSTINGLIQGFSIAQLNTQLKGFLPAIESAITNFAILKNQVGVQIPQEFFEKKKSLLEELQQFIIDAEGFDLDDRLKDVVKREIRMLIALLHNAEAVGVEAALASYAQLLIKIRNRIDPKNENQKNESIKLWDKIMSWSERLDALMKLYDAGQRMLPYIDKIPQIPGLS